MCSDHHHSVYGGGVHVCGERCACVVTTITVCMGEVCMCV